MNRYYIARALSEGQISKTKITEASSLIEACANLRIGTKIDKKTGHLYISKPIVLTHVEYDINKADKVR